ncbi:hypothetical protein BU24DRAFT_469605 [Aaosphaeria arxii CBS 175.79]|uniref:Uncharacterized protein n=1 Tax=Aaosphaeria arxii CBS 175.79 TaxID=1450172 RepID=A0A6A5Y5I7_9PLEO|nr:uncharacterized protein BU24DRAFT_469605 [Aaosphaeria arxii CBS 175.79]KAF2020822.1 hypothetical protein BU24DRAFT_469605 [Aaosphaeria arxii CBS 175.79]
MAAHVTSLLLSQHLSLFPSPLHINKLKTKNRRATFRRLSSRKLLHGTTVEVIGYEPLDDIINEIKGDLLLSKPSSTAQPGENLTSLNWVAASHPVSRAPSNQPLAVRKTRASRSTTSETNNSDVGRLGSYTSSEANDLEWASRPTLFEFTEPQMAPGVEADRTGQQSEQTASEQLNALLDASVAAPQGGTRKKLFSLGKKMEKFRLRSNTDEPAAPSPPFSMSPPNGFHRPANEVDNHLPVQSPRECPQIEPDDFANAWKLNIGRSTRGNDPYHSQFPSGFAPPAEYREDYMTAAERAGPDGPTLSTLNPSVRIIPECKVLKGDAEQTFWLAVEVEGMIHNRKMYPDNRLDLIILIDNAYYVTSDCLEQATEHACSLMHHLRVGDRVALYSSNCTHENVSGNVPDKLLPLSCFGPAIGSTVRDLARDMRSQGVQTWEWPRPNPSLDDMLIAILNDIKGYLPRAERTHVMILSPTPREAHKVSAMFPKLHVHQINPSVLPFHKDDGLDTKLCNRGCCDNFTLSHLEHDYQATGERLKKILFHARCERTVDAISKIMVKITPMAGCKILECRGPTYIPHLRSGQVHTFFVQIEVSPQQVAELDVDNLDNIMNAALLKDNLKQDCLNAKITGAIKTHILSIEMMYRSSLYSSHQWMFSKTPFIIFKDLGRMSSPVDRAFEFHQRRIFYEVTHLRRGPALDKLRELAAAVQPDIREPIDNLAERMSRELRAHTAIRDHEVASRQNLPHCFGPLSISGPHHRVVAIWKRYQNPEDFPMDFE